MLHASGYETRFPLLVIDIATDADITCLARLDAQAIMDEKMKSREGITPHAT
jgi:hypothetical protein